MACFGHLEAQMPQPLQEAEMVWAFSPAVDVSGDSESHDPGAVGCTAFVADDDTSPAGSCFDTAVLLPADLLPCCLHASLQSTVGLDSVIAGRYGGLARVGETVKARHLISATLRTRQRNRVVFRSVKAAVLSRRQTWKLCLSYPLHRDVGECHDEI